MLTFKPFSLKTRMSEAMRKQLAVPDNTDYAYDDTLALEELLKVTGINVPTNR